MSSRLNFANGITDSRLAACIRWFPVAWADSRLAGRIARIQAYTNFCFPYRFLSRANHPCAYFHYSRLSWLLERAGEGIESVWRDSRASRSLKGLETYAIVSAVLMDGLLKFMNFSGTYLDFFALGLDGMLIFIGFLCALMTPAKKQVWADSVISRSLNWLDSLTARI